MNAFRCTPDGRLDRSYLRISAVYRLLQAKRIGQTRALVLLADRHTPNQMASLRNTVALWRAHPIRDMLS